MQEKAIWEFTQENYPGKIPGKSPGEMLCPRSCALAYFTQSYLSYSDLAVQGHTNRFTFRKCPLLQSHFKLVQVCKLMHMYTSAWHRVELLSPSYGLLVPLGLHMHYVVKHGILHDYYDNVVPLKEWEHVLHCIWVSNLWNNAQCHIENCFVHFWKFFLSLLHSFLIGYYYLWLTRFCGSRQVYTCG